MGMRRGMDRSAALVGAVTALGGGTVRDVLLGHYPLGWIAHPEYLVITLVAATVASWAARHVTRMKTLFVTVDAIGLAAFTIIGCDVGASTGTAPIIVVLAGAITGVCGGMLRDLLCNEMPLILREELYASVAFVTGGLCRDAASGRRCGHCDGRRAGSRLLDADARRALGWKMRTFGATDLEH